MIKELCYNLAEKRKKLGLSIEDVVEKTKLCPSVIRDIEDGNLTNINATYFRGFIKIYASFLGVELGAGIFDEISSLNSAATNTVPKGQTFSKTNVLGRKSPQSAGSSSVPIEIASQSSVSASKRAGGRKYIDMAREKIPLGLKKNIPVFVIGAVVLVSLFGFSKFIVGKIFKGGRAQKEKAVASDSSQEGEKVSSRKKDKSLAGIIDTSLKVKRDCFVRVKVDGKLLFEGILNKGTVEMWKGTKEIEYKISDGSAVYLEVNGNPLPPLTSMRKPIKSLKITHSGISVDK
ncbi:MAG: helix-turn-helix domain-containing protein [Candidatus Omnitrophota bacterium]|nr:MAG: helix-turn-helix domain-containing protein [Candidatus Omnitrophota bacterium]